MKDMYQVREDEIYISSLLNMVLKKIVLDLLLKKIIIKKCILANNIKQKFLIK